MDINKCGVTNWKERSKNRADAEKSIKEGKDQIGLQYHQKRRR
jgi:hypothetical protein